MRNRSVRLLLLVVILCPICVASSQTIVDKNLLADILKIKAIDNHSHAMPFKMPEASDGERLDPIGKTSIGFPVRLRVPNTEYIQAWQALYGYKHSDMGTDHAREALKAKVDIMKEKGEGYPSWVLDQAGIEAVLVNMPSLGPGQNAPRFLWVPRADGFLFPLGGDEERINWFRSEVRLHAQPGTLDEYLDTIRMRLDQWKMAGTPAIKFAVAYLRPLDFAPVPSDEAQRAFLRCRESKKLSVGDSKTLQDFLFFFIAREAGRRGLAVQIHTGIGAEPYFNISGSNPMLLERALNDTSLRQTKFILLHCGWPFTREAGALLMKPNIFVDFSTASLVFPPEALSNILQGWLEWFPEKVLFGTDAYPENTPLANWDEKTWLASRTSREALALALTRMMKEGQLTRSRAVELARMVMHDNAASLYRIENH